MTSRDRLPGDGGGLSQCTLSSVDNEKCKRARGDEQRAFRHPIDDPAFMGLLERENRLCPDRCFFYLSNSYFFELADRWQYGQAEPWFAALEAREPRAMSLSLRFQANPERSGLELFALALTAAEQEAVDAADAEWLATQEQTSDASGPGRGAHTDASNLRQS